MNELVKNRSEILFIYDVTNANPNGDPDENKPRIDEETGINIVTDVRLKRTVRDYLMKFRKQEIFVREVRDENGNLKTRDDLFKEYGKKENVIERCIDIRLFGGTFAIQEQRFALTGPVQFKFGYSLHRVGEPFYIRGTTVLPSAEKKEAGTFWEGYILPYSLIVFYGIVNENAAKDTRLTEEDIDLLLDGLWNGTKNLITRSKAGQMPRLLIQVVYEEKNYHVGELDRFIKLKPKERKEEEIRKITDFCLDLTCLANVLQENKEKIKKIRYAKDKYLKILKDNEEVELENLVTGVEYESLLNILKS